MTFKQRIRVNDIRAIVSADDPRFVLFVCCKRIHLTYRRKLQRT
jgi:hypothetical protein